MNFSLRIYRFIYVILAYIGGFLGIALGLFIQMVIMGNLKSFGASYLAPYLPVTNYARNRSFILKPFWQTEKILAGRWKSMIRSSPEISDILEARSCWNF